MQQLKIKDTFIQARSQEVESKENYFSTVDSKSFNADEEIETLKALMNVLQDKYNKARTYIKNCRSSALLQVMTDEIYSKFVTEVLDSAGEQRREQILNRIIE